MKNKIFQSRDLCLRALDTNSLCAKNVRRNEDKYAVFREFLGKLHILLISILQYIIACDTINHTKNSIEKRRSYYVLCDKRVFYVAKKNVLALTMLNAVKGGFS